MMATRSLGTLTVDVVAKIGGFVRGMDEAERTSKKRMDRIAREVSAAGKAIGVAFAAAGVAIGVGVREAIDAADAINDMSLRTGVSTEALSRLEVAAKLTGTSLDALQTSFIKLARTQQDALAGGEAQQQAFAKLGISLEELRSLNPEQLLGAVADGVKSIQDPSAQVAAALEVLGRGAADLLPLMKEGGRGIAEYSRLADELGITLSKETTEAAAKFKDQMDLVSLGMDGAYRKAADDLLPVLDDLASQLNSEDFREGFSSIVTGASAATVKVAELVAELGNLAKWAGEEAAAQIGGIGGEDIVRLEQQRDHLQGLIDGLVVDLPAIASWGMVSSLESWKAELAKVDKAIADFYANQGADAPQGFRREMRLGTRVKPESSNGGTGTAAVEERAESLQEYLLGLQQVGREETALREAWAQLEAQLAGPMASALYDHQQQLKAIEKAGHDAGASAEEIAAAKAKETEAFEASTAALQAQLDPYPQMLRDLAFENELIGMGNAERATAIQLRGADAESVAKYGDALQALNEDYERLSEAQAAVDQFQQSFEDSVASVLDGSESIKDAIRDMVSDFIAQMARAAAQRLTESLFGEMGTSGTGSAGGGWLAAFASLFGGGKAVGGPVMSGVPYLVGERGPELMVPNSSGTVIPAGPTKQMMSRAGGDIHQHFHHPVSRETLTQSRIQLSREMRKANGEFA